MSGTRIGIARITAMSLIDTLTENDFFNVITVKQDVRYMRPCTRHLIQATRYNNPVRSPPCGRCHLFFVIRDFLSSLDCDLLREKYHIFCYTFYIFFSISSFCFTFSRYNKEKMKVALQRMGAVTNITNATLGVREAFNILNSGQTFNRTSGGCNRMIMFISDGVEEKEIAKDVFAEENANRTTRVFTFLIGKFLLHIMRSRYG